MALWWQRKFAHLHWFAKRPLELQRSDLHSDFRKLHGLDRSMDLRWRIKSGKPTRGLHRRKRRTGCPRERGYVERRFGQFLALRRIWLRRQRKRRVPERP